MSGFGGFSNAIGAGLRLGMLSTVATIGSNVMNIASAIGKASSHKQSISSSLNTGADFSSMGNKGGPRLDGSGDVFEAGGDEGCNCPPGYGPKPKPGKNPKPYFLDIDDAAIDWSKTWGRKSGGKTGKAIERSSLIYGITAANGVVLYQYTFAVRFENNEVAKISSPGPADYINHAPIPSGHVQYGQIHLHWLGSTTLGQDVGSDNRTFSSGPNRDNEINSKFSQFTMYVLGSKGTLWASYSNNMSLIKNNMGGYDGDSREGKQIPVSKTAKIDFYKDDLKNLKPCECYEQ